jgi:hypothetical protein
LAKVQLRTKQVTCLFLMLMSMLVGFSFLRSTTAEMTILSISPGTGNVGTNVTLTANLTTTDGGYNVTFDGVLQVVGNATGNDVSTNFTVPETTFGDHNVTVIDVKTNENATGVFSVSTAYSLNVSVPTLPAQLQEGDSVPISVTVTGGNSSSMVVATFTVQTPSGTSYTEQLNISTSALGSGNATLVYPGNFSAGANTSYVGDYTVSLDLSNATMPFTVGLTNSTEYHRMQAVSIRAAYAQNENVTLTVSGNDIYGNSIYTSVNLTADSAGVIDYSNWTVPVIASVGTYTVSIVSMSHQTVKVPADTQSFTVPGFAFNVTAKNLVGEPVPNVEVRAFEQGTYVYNQTTSSEGLAVLMLEIGNYTLQGYSEGVDVGEGNFTVTNSQTIDLGLNLTNLDIRVVAVVNGTEIGVPEATVYLTPEGATLTTDITGNVVAHSLLPNATRTLNASRYDTVFNTTTITSLLIGENLVPVFNVTIMCPSFTLKVDAYKADGQPFDNATVEIEELIGGIHYNGNTNSSGTVVFQKVTFGKYNVEVFDNNTGSELNSTVVSLFQDQNASVYCNLYDLNISVSVADYFGQPFPNLNVTLQGMTLQGKGFELLSNMTQADGTVTFYHLVGDSFSVSVYVSERGPPTVVKSLVVDGSTVVPISMNKYVLLAGFVVETSQLAIAIVIVLSLLMVLVLEVYRIRRRKSTKIES